MKMWELQEFTLNDHTRIPPSHILFKWSYSALQFLIAGYIFVLLWILVWMTLPALCLVGRVDWQTMCLTGEKVANLNQSIWTCIIISCTYIDFFCIIYNLQAILWYLKLWFLANSAKNSLKKLTISMIIICFIIYSFCQSSGAVSFFFVILYLFFI